MAKAIAAVVAFAATLLGLIFLLWPSLQPEPPPPTRTVALSDLRADHPVTFGTYLRRAGQSAGGLDRTVLRRPGILASFEYRIVGYKDRKLPLVWRLVGARDGRVLEAGDGLSIASESPTDRGTLPVWLDLPSRRPRQVFVEVTLYEPRGRLSLDTERTRPFTVE